MGAVVDRRPARQPVEKGADKRIGGNVFFGKTSRAIVPVKAGANAGREMIQKLRGVIETPGGLAALRAGLGVPSPAGPGCAQGCG